MSRITSAGQRENVAATPVASLPCPIKSNFLRLLANSPAVTEGYVAFESALAHGRLTERERALLALTVAQINGCKYGLCAQTARAREAGLSEDEIQLARKATARFPKEAALLQFTQEVVLQRADISDTDFQALRRAGYTDEQIAEIMANIGLNIFTNYFNSVAQTDIDTPWLQTAEGHTR